MNIIAIQYLWNKARIFLISDWPLLDYLLSKAGLHYTGLPWEQSDFNSEVKLGSTVTLRRFAHSCVIFPCIADEVSEQSVSDSCDYATTVSLRTKLRIRFRQLHYNLVTLKWVTYRILAITWQRSARQWLLCAKRLVKSYTPLPESCLLWTLRNYNCWWEHLSFLNLATVRLFGCFGIEMQITE